jgi:hypothetical protein
MMDEATNELLSRHLDGDLSPDEERELTTRLKKDVPLAAQLDAMRRVRSSVADLAANERVPAELDSVLEPLLNSHPESLPARPWARWLATAAVAVLGLTVVIEVNRRDPGPDIGAIARQAEKQAGRSEEPFALAPLPTSSLPAEEQPLGASDRLLASPIPEMELAAPPPLEVLGPLQQEVRSDGATDVSGDEAADAANVGAAMAEKKAASGRAKKAITPPTTKSDQPAAAAQPEKGGTREIYRDDAAQPWDEDSPKGRAKLFVFDDGRSAWREFTPSRSCKPGRYTVRIKISGGTVLEARSVGGAAAASPSQRLCAADLIIDLEIEDIADGEYQAEIVIERR